jgi:hypothetical protein
MPPWLGYEGLRVDGEFGCLARLRGGFLLDEEDDKKNSCYFILSWVE